MSIFIEALQQNLRFETSKGLMTTEDLFSLPMTSTKANQPNLEDITRGVYQKFHSTAPLSFISNTGRSQESIDNELRLEILQAVIELKKAKNAEQVAAADRRRQREVVAEVLERKKAQELESLSVEQLEAMLKG